MKNEVTVMPEQKAVAVFSEFDTQLKKCVKEAKSVVFDITTKKGNKEARSFIATIRKSKKPVNDAHQAAKAESRNFGLLLDKEKNRIITAIDDVIETHDAPLRELEAAEEKRMDDIKTRIGIIELLSHAASIDSGLYNSVELNANLTSLNTIIIDDSFDEFEELAAQAKASSIVILEALISSVTEQEEKDAELEVFRATEAARKQGIIDDQAREDAEQAIKDAEEQVKKDAAKTLKEAGEQAERDKQKAINDERERVAQEKRDTAAAALLVAQTEERKAANKNHQRAFNKEALADFTANGILNGKEIIELIAQGKIKNVTINY